MIDKPRILGVDDDAINQLFLKEILGDDYSMTLCSNGHECLSYLEKDIPDIILMDVNMPGLSGLDTCKQIRKIPNCSELPVIFVSTLATKEDKIAGYEAGGDDYLTKPFEKGELKSKLKLLLMNKQRVLELKKPSDLALKTAMLSMTNTGELGTVIDFLKKTYQATTPQELAVLVVQSLEVYGLQGSVLLNILDQQVFISNERKHNSVELKLMEKEKNNGRIIEYGSRLIFNGERASLLVKNMSFKDERKGRLRDHLAIIMDGLDASLNKMAISDQLDHSINVNQHVKKQTLSLLQELRISHKNQQNESNSIFFEFHNEMEEVYHLLELSEEQEEMLNALVLTADEKMSGVYEIGLYLDKKLEKIISDFDR